MDKSWVHLDRRSPEYYAGLKVFLDGAPKSVPENEIVCPCIKCKNRDSYDRRTVEQHLVVKGMWPFYMNTRWKEHGESDPEFRNHMESQNNGEVEINGMQGFLNETFVQPTIGETVGSSNMFEGPTPEAEKFYKLLEDANKEVYPGCKFKKLEAVVRLYQIKCLGGVSDNIFSKFVNFFKELLPEGECLPDSFYHTKKLVSELGLTFEKIDACPNDCMLFWKGKDAALKKCKHCHTSRYVEGSESSGKPVPAKVLRYFPLKPRLQRLYMSKHTASHMRWHATECPKDVYMRHPSDSPAWKHLDSLYPEFGSESRNVRLGLASDGFNPFGNMTPGHSTWPVVISVYNLPPWMCMKQSNLFLSLLIPGPRAHGNDIDVYLEPLIDELKELWEADMQKKLAELVAEEGEETTELRQRAYVSVMGPEKRYRVRGYGLGVMPEMVPYVQTESSSSSHRSHGKHYACLLSQFMELESKYKQQQEQAQVQQVRTQEQLLETQRELAMIKQMLQSQQSAPSSQQSSQFSQQPSFQMPSYPPQMYWPQPQMYPQMPYQPQPAYPTTSLTGLLMGDASVQEAELLNQLRASSNQSSHVS